MPEITESVFNEPPFTGFSLVPENGVVRKIIFLLHGYQGDALSNLAFGRTLAHSIPDAAVIIPDGISQVPAQENPSVRQWWNLRPFDGRTMSCFTRYAKLREQEAVMEMAGEANETARLLNAFVIGQLERYGLTSAECFIAGISQGAMTAFEMVLFRQELGLIGGMAGIGSGVLYPDRLAEAEHPLGAAAFLLARGKYDEIFPKTVDSFTASLLRELGFSVQEAEADSGHYGLEHNAADEVIGFLSQK